MKKGIVWLISMMPSKLRSIAIKLIKKMEKEYMSPILRAVWSEIYGIEVGIGSYGCFEIGNFSKGDRIGNYCSVAQNVWHLNANHPMNHATMSPIFYQKAFAGNANAKDVDRTGLTIGHDVWIGRDVKILAGVTHIGNGAVIGAGSVVTKNIEQYTVVAGVPAKQIRKRFNEETIACLEESKWWTIAPNQLMLLQDFVDKPLVFAQKAKEMVD